MKMPLPGKHYRAPNLLQISMPMGGIGAGCLCLNGHGGIQDFSIWNAPSVTAAPDGNGFTEPAAFGLIHIKGARPITRLLEGPLPPEKIYDQALQAQGYRHGGHEGMPRFRGCTFGAQYPFGHVDLSDPTIPVSVRLTGYSPFIPLDDFHSGLPASILEYTFQNDSTERQEIEFSYHVSHLAPGTKTLRLGDFTRAIPGRGVLFLNQDESDARSFGTFCLLSLGVPAKVKGAWCRGWWFDAIATLWREASTGTFLENDGTEGKDRTQDERAGGSILFNAQLDPGEAVTFPLVLAWHFPNPGNVQGYPEDAARNSEKLRWRNYYAGKFQNAQAVAEHVRSQYGSLRSRTLAFAEALHGSTLPAEVLDAITCNLAILKSPTILRQENGNLWAWEGCFPNAGSCYGSCTHVWNYAQALPHLFPHLERTLREAELVRSMNDLGHAHFRAVLPDGPATHEGPAAADGQLGGILKVWREWQISGDEVWLARMYPLAKRSLEYCITTWDPDRRGALFEPHHNTYDIEFWGPDGMCTSIYVSALMAMADLALHHGEPEYAEACRDLASRGAAYMSTELYNGEYYHQKVQYRDLRDQSFVEMMKSDTADQMMEIMRREGPIHQYSTGCLSDGVIGAWMADLYGVKTPLRQEEVQSTLKAIYHHNFRSSLWDHVNLQRPGYALGDEAGLVLCSWPDGNVPTLPFVYCDEVWTGIEYQVASHLILNGMVTEGLNIVRAARSRFDGHVRNPFNEYECGSYYARALSSYSLLQALSGYRYSAVTKTLEYGPRLPERPFSTFFSTSSSFGRIVLEEETLSVLVLEGELPIQCIRLTLDGDPREFPADITVTANQPYVLNFPQ